MKDNKTPHLGLPLPHEENELEDDCPRIAKSFGILDEHVASLETGAKADGIAIIGLQKRAATLEQAREAAVQALASQSAAISGLQDDKAQKSDVEALGRELAALAAAVAGMKADPWSVFPQRVPVAVAGVTFPAQDKTRPVLDESGQPVLDDNGEPLVETIAGWKRHPIMPGETEPRENWLVCDGGADGQGGAVPDLRGRMILGASDNHPADSAGGAETQAVSFGVSGSVGWTTLTEAQMPWHVHQYLNRADRGSTAGYGETGTPANFNTTGTGGSQGHTHGFSGTASGNVSTLSPYYALAFVMRVA